LVSLTLADEKLDRIIKLEKLYNMGLITEKEYDTRKSKLINDYLEMPEPKKSIEVPGA
jgi:hypothetical protein